MATDCMWRCIFIKKDGGESAERWFALCVSQVTPAQSFFSSRTAIPTFFKKHTPKGASRNEFMQKSPKMLSGPKNRFRVFEGLVAALPTAS